MFKQTVVGVDEHHGGRDAIALARDLLARDGELTLAHVYTGDPLFHREGHLRWRSAPSVGHGLHAICREIDADLLVVGSSRRGLLGRVFIGDDTRASLNGAPCTIAVAPAGYARDPAATREIGVGYDGSPESEHALELGRLLAAETGATLSVFEAIALLPSRYFAGDPRPLTRVVDSVVAEAREGLVTLGGIEAHAAYGQPAEELAAYSASVDLLVVGAHGSGSTGAPFRASTSQRLARRARCPLLVLPRSSRKGERRRYGDCELASS